MAKFLNTSATNYFLEELTEKAKQAGGESKTGRFGAYFLWDENLSV